ncbi:putative GPI-anchored protein pfl2 [Cotesia glomerata]|uniref:putative GPI-anchored protein pfl2 n=1 Tax=Cotesia glomerata TaxID=32391 RepID=UPI001D016DFA|nr:putative GPI-anchored protein pfl2 [Cotesia glomerata]
MHALIFWPKENATSVIQTTLINKRLEFNRVTVRWGRQNVTAFLIAESEDIVWLQRLIVNTCGVITGYVNDRLMTDACIQFSTSSQDGNGAVDNSLGHSSNHFQFDSVGTADIVERTAIAAASTTPDVIVIPTMNPITTPNAPTTLDSDSDAAVNLTTAPTSFTTLDVVAVTSIDLISTLNTLTAVDVDADAAENLTVTPSCFTTEIAAVIPSMDPITPPSTFITPDIAAVIALDLSTTPSKSTTPHIAVAATVDLTATLTPLPTLDIAAVSALDLTTTPSASTTPHIAAVAAVDLTATPISLPILDIAAVSALDLTTTSSASSTSHIAGVSAMGQTIIPSVNKTLDIAAAAAVNLTGTLTPFATLDDAGVSALDQITTPSASTTADIGVVSAMDLTTKSSALTTLSVAAAAPVNGDFDVPSTSTSTGNRAMVALIEGSSVLIEYHKKKGVLRFTNKPKEMTRRLLLSIIGREQLKCLTLTEIKLNPLLFGILSAVEKFTLQNSDTEYQLTTDQFNKCVTSFLYNLKHSKNPKLM